MGLLFSAMLTALYSTLYGLLVSEDNALLMGSLLVFASIATATMLTRKVNGCGLQTPGKPGGTKTVPA